jgi:hypothetical protein
VSDTCQAKARRRARPGEVAVPEQVTVSMSDIADSAQEGPLALAVGTRRGAAERRITIMDVRQLNPNQPEAFAYRRLGERSP